MFIHREVPTCIVLGQSGATWGRGRFIHILLMETPPQSIYVRPRVREGALPWWPSIPMSLSIPTLALLLRGEPASDGQLVCGLLLSQG